MKYRDYNDIILVGESSEGCADAGSSWYETVQVSPDMTLKEAIEWADRHSVNGKLIISVGKKLEEIND